MPACPGLARSSARPTVGANGVTVTTGGVRLGDVAAPWRGGSSGIKSAQMTAAMLKVMVPSTKGRARLRSLAPASTRLASVFSVSISHRRKNSRIPAPRPSRAASGHH